VEVARILAEMRMEADTVISGLLHDTVEDTTLTLQEIELLFGRTVRTIVEVGVCVCVCVDAPCACMDCLRLAGRQAEGFACVRGVAQGAVWPSMRCFARTNKPDPQCPAPPTPMSRARPRCPSCPSWAHRLSLTRSGRRRTLGRSSSHLPRCVCVLCSHVLLLYAFFLLAFVLFLRVCKSVTRQAWRPHANPMMHGRSPRQHPRPRSTHRTTV
jgi:hypothetical protein